jgi:hypothetical protein
MARNENYTRTGKGFLADWANKAAMVPGLGMIVTPVLGGIDTLVETAQWLFRGKILSAATAFVAGSVSTAVNTGLSGVDSINWWGGGFNVVSGLATGRSIGTHARALTENAIGGVTGMLGQRPTVLRSYPAGIGNIGGQGAQQSRPGYWSSRVAQEQGQDPQRRWQQYVDDSRQGAAAAGRA